MSRADVVAVVPVRAGQLPAGADEVIAEAGGVAVLVGDGTAEAAAATATATAVRAVELGAYQPGGWAVALAPLLGDVALVLLPASPDGRDLAPRLAHALGRPLLAGASLVTPTSAVLVRRGGLVSETHAIDGPTVVTLVPGVRGFEPVDAEPLVELVELAVDRDPVLDAELVELVPPDPATVDLAEARRIVAGGAGLGGPELFEVLARVAPQLGAAYGATRVASDIGWAPHDRYIGTTGVTVDPDLYIALGISGAVQHITGLGQPDHIVSINLDPSAPMMAMADLAIVADARQVLVELEARLAPAAAATADPAGAADPTDPSREATDG